MVGFVVNTTGRNYVGRPYITVRTQDGLTHLVGLPPAATPNFFLDSTMVFFTPRRDRDVVWNATLASCRKGRTLVNSPRKTTPP